MHAVIEMSQWLDREKLNRHELQDCLSKARGAAFPNMTAELLLDDVRKGTHTMVAGPFFPRASGSLGRLMANDPNLSWMVTTVTCLFQFHSAREVNRCVRDLIVAAVRKESDAEVGCHDPSRVHLGRVVDKIVSSIWFNVVNAGRMTIQLPEELTSICGNGHHLESLDFATVVEALRSGKPRLMVRSQHLLYNIVLWVLYHFDGFLQVVVGGKIIYKKELGERRQAIEFRVDRSCAGTGCCGVRERSTFEVFEDISDNPKCFFSGLYNPPKARGNIETAMVRRKLYQLPDAHLVESRARQHGIQILIKCTAQKMMRWILSLGVSSPYDFTNLGFRVQLEGEPEARYRKTRDLFHRSPSILN